MKKIIAILILLCFFEALYIFYLRTKDPPTGGDSVKTEIKTIYVNSHDTIYQDRLIYEEKIDTIIHILYNNDTIEKEIEIPIEIPIEHREYTFDKDSINGHIFYHGYKAGIDSINISSIYTYNIYKKKRWAVAIGPTLGFNYYGGNFNGNSTKNPIIFTAGIGICIGKTVF